jgi:acyl-CoA thioester hydrolase
MATPEPGARIEVHVSRQAVRWGDMDALGHVNNTCYFRYMEQARIEWLFALSKEDEGGYADGTGPVIVNASCTFLEQLAYPADLEVRMSLDSPGRTSVMSRYELRAGERRVADGAAKIVWIDLASGRPTPLPTRVRSLFESGGATWA